MKALPYFRTWSVQWSGSQATEHTARTLIKRFLMVRGSLRGSLRHMAQAATYALAMRQHNAAAGGGAAAIKVARPM